MIKKFFSKMQNRQFFFAPKIQYELAAERSEANLSNLQFPMWCVGRDSNPRRPMANRFTVCPRCHLSTYAYTKFSNLSLCFLFIGSISLKNLMTSCLLVT